LTGDRSRLILVYCGHQAQQTMKLLLVLGTCSNVEKYFIAALERYLKEYSQATISLENESPQYVLSKVREALRIMKEEPEDILTLYIGSNTDLISGKIMSPKFNLGCLLEMIILAIHGRDLPENRELIPAEKDSIRHFFLGGVKGLIDKI